MVFSVRLRLIDGTEVVQEAYKPRPTNADPTMPETIGEDTPRRGPNTPAKGHHDIITDIAMCQATQSMFITASRDGVVKLWK